MNIQNRKFIVTGGASGLGQAVVRHIANKGGKVVIFDRDTQRGNETASEIGDAVDFVEVDITDAGSVENAINKATEIATIHGAISCAGIGSAEKVLGKEGPHDLDRFRKVIEVNLIGTFNVMRLACAKMAENTPDDNNERGVIVNLASIAAFDGQKGQVAYSASKAGLVGLTLPAARDLARSGIRVMTVAPGTFDTPLLGTLSDEIRMALAAAIPHPNRLGNPEELAMLVGQIIENPMLNGETIRIDGALRMM